MKLLTGHYTQVKEACIRMFADGYFDFHFLYVPETERFRELDRFLYESRHTLRFHNEYSGNVILDITEWNRKPPNGYFEAFMYYLRDHKDQYNCALIVSERCSKELLAKLREILKDIEEVQMPVLQEQKRMHIGFIPEESHEVNHVRS